MELYGVARSRAFRCLWALEEAGVAYTHVPVDYIVGAKQPDYRKLNPNGRVPCLRDGELVLFESLAINLYVARRYGGALMPSAIDDEARALQWTLWATNELEPHLSLISFQRERAANHERDPDAIRAAEAKLQGPLQVLGDALAGHEQLLGSSFTIADLNVASVLVTALSARFDLRPYDGVRPWLRRCLERPAAARALAMASG